MHGKNSRVYVWWKSEERWITQCLELYGSRNGSARVSVMLLGCICNERVGTITDVEGNITSAKYIDILDTLLWPIVAKYENNQWIFQDDNAPVNQSVQTTLWKYSNDVNCLDWPSQSPDLNIIENIWKLIKIQLQRKQHTIHSKGDLIRAFTIIWYSFSSVYFKLISISAKTTKTCN